MPSNRIPHYLYKRNHTWWFRKRFTSQGRFIEYRLSLKTASLDHARFLALRLQALCLKMIASLKEPREKKGYSMDKTVQSQVRAKLRALINEWTEEETERWFSGTTYNPGDLDNYLEILDSVVSDLKERISLDDRPSLHQKEADTVLSKLPHLNAILTPEDIKQIAREVAQAKVKSLTDTKAIILGNQPSWMSMPPPENHEAGEGLAHEIYRLSEMIYKYQNENEIKNHSKKTQNKYAQCLALALSFFGDVCVSSITPSKGREFRELLPLLPLGLSTKSLLDTPLNELISKSTSHDKVTTATANSHLEKIRRFFEWMHSTGHLTTSNPIPKEPLPTPKRNNKEARHSMSDADALKVFSHHIFTNHKGIKTQKIQHPYHFWLPLLCLFTGLRPNEACQLHIRDVELVGKSYCIRVDKRYEGQTLKTPSAQRYVPLHERMISIGFINFINELKLKRGIDAKVFPEITPMQDYHSHKPGEWFNRNLRDKQKIAKDATLYTFRHAFRDKLVIQNASTEYLQRLMGHQGNSYGLPLLPNVEKMKELIDCIDFNEITMNVKPYSSLDIFHSF